MPGPRIAFLRRIVVLLAACVLTAACAEAPRDAIRMGLASAPITLDPRYATDATSARLNRLLYARLVDFDEAARPAPSLAHWQRLSPTHYRFRLSRTRAPFHDGRPLQAADVKATYDSVLDPRTDSPHRSSLAIIERIVAVDADTVDFYLTRPDPLFPGYLVIGILPRAAIEAGHPFDRQPLGSGAFRFSAWPAEGVLRLQRRADGQLFEFLHVSDSTVRVLKLLRGELDLLQNDLPPELVRYLEQQPQIAVHHRQGVNFSYLGFNLDDPVLADVRVRRAIAHAIDRRAIARHLLGGETRLAAALLPPEHWAGVALQPPVFAPERARALLARAGYGPQRPLRLDYRTTSDPLRLRIATVIQRQLEEVGIVVELSSFDWATFYADIKAGRFQLYSLSWVGIKSPDIFRYVFHSAAVPPAGANRGRFADTEVDRLIEAAETAEGPSRRAALYQALQRRLLERLPYVPLWYEGQFVAARSDIGGYMLSADGDYDSLAGVARRAVDVHHAQLPP